MSRSQFLDEHASDRFQKRHSSLEAKLRAISRQVIDLVDSIAEAGLEEAVAQEEEPGLEEASEELFSPNLP